jgi:ATP-dependent RNA helicase DeaD
MQQDNKEDKLKNSLKVILEQQDLSSQQKLITRLSTELQVSILECAAALSLLNQSKSQKIKLNAEKQGDLNTKKDYSSPHLFKHKPVRYRLDVGKKHQVSADEIKNTLIEVSGVERMCINRVDIRNFYTMVDLPEGMPADIFQLLAETKINKQKLNIKRIKYQRRFHRRNHNK